MRSITLLAIALCISTAFALKFKGNITYNQDADGWDYRRTAIWEFPHSVQYSSRDVNRTHGDGHRDFNVSGIYGGGFFFENTVPYSYIASYQVDSEWARNNFTNASWQSVDVSGALSFISTAYTRIHECTPNGTVVVNQKLRFGDDGLIWKSDYSEADQELSFTSFVGRPNGTASSWNINITFIASTVIGVVDLANAVVGPSSFEQVVQINNWPYQSPNNYLTLVMITGTGAATASDSASITTVSTGTNSSALYFSASETVVSAGTTQQVTVSATTTTSIDEEDIRGNADLLVMIAAKYANATYTTIKTNFPAGAASIAYDPAQGAGTPLPAASTSTSSEAAPTTSPTSAPSPSTTSSSTPAPVHHPSSSSVVAASVVGLLSALVASLL